MDRRPEGDPQGPPAAHPEGPAYNTRSRARIASDQGTNMPAPGGALPPEDPAPALGAPNPPTVENAVVVGSRSDRAPPTLASAGRPASAPPAELMAENARVAFFPVKAPRPASSMSSLPAPHSAATAAEAFHSAQSAPIAPHPLHPRGTLQALLPPAHGHKASWCQLSRWTWSF